MKLNYEKGGTRSKPVNVNVICLFKILLASVAKAEEILRGRVGPINT